MDTRSYVDSKFLKAKINVNSGDHIRIEDEGRDDETRKEGESPKMILSVMVLAGGTEEKYTKEFSPNNTNLKVIQRLFGFDSKEWVGKELRVNIEKVRNPQTGLKVDGIVLSRVGEDSEGNIIQG